jgi:hypothetical protein
MTLYAPDGITHANQQTLDLPVGAVRWFIDGVALLHHLNDLRTVRVKVVCEGCGDDAVARTREIQGDVFVACGHRPSGGRVSVGQGLEVEPLLLALGWGFRCTACDARLTGDNDRTATVFTITCPCTRRVYRLPVA